MLGKLIKYEFKSTWKVMSLAVGLMIITTIYGLISITYTNKNNDTDYKNMSLVIGTLGFFTMFVAALVFAYVFIIKRFYDSVYSKQGYLTLTLPANKNTILNAKLLTGVIWLIIIVILAMTFSFILSACAWDRPMSEILSDFLATVKDNLSINIACAYTLAGFLSVLHSLTFVFASISLGQLSSKSKIGSAILYGILIHIVESTIKGVLMIATLSSERYNSMMGSVINGYEMWPRVAVFGIMCCVEYLVCVYIIKYKVNLQ